MGQFAVENIQNEWKVYVKKPLDREQRDNYLLTITATDGTFSSKAIVEVKVLDANDNSPVCEKVSCSLSAYITNPGFTPKPPIGLWRAAGLGWDAEVSSGASHVITSSCVSRGECAVGQEMGWPQNWFRACSRSLKITQNAVNYGLDCSSV